MQTLLRPTNTHLQIHYRRPHIVIPPHAHDGTIESKAIVQKIPFLCEKPVGLDLPTCKNLSQQIEKTNLITSSGYLLRYELLFEKIKEILARNKISTIRICSYFIHARSSLVA